MQEYFLYNPDQASKGIWDYILAVMPIVVSLILVIIAARAVAQTAKNAKRQAVDNLSAKRQIWIEDLQKDAAECLALLSRREELRRPNSASKEAEQKQTFDHARAVDLKALECGIRIKLRLNPNNTDHQTLQSLFEKLRNACLPPLPGETPEQMQASQKAFWEHSNQIISQFQSIFIQEWRRITDGSLIDQGKP